MTAAATLLQGRGCRQGVATLYEGTRSAEGDIIRVGLLQRGEEVRLVRFSLYHRTDHVVTLAVNDAGRLVEGAEPPDSTLLRAPSKPLSRHWYPAGIYHVSTTASTVRPCPMG